MLKKKEVGGMFQKKAVGDAMSKFTGRIQATAKHIGKKAHKFKFDIVLERISGLKKGSYYLKWVRGSKGIKTPPKSLTSAECTEVEGAPFSDTLSLSVTLYRDEKTERFDDKESKLLLLQFRKDRDGEKTERVVGKVYINLTDYIGVPFAETNVKLDMNKQLIVAKARILCTFLMTAKGNAAASSDAGSRFDDGSSVLADDLDDLDDLAMDDLDDLAMDDLDDLGMGSTQPSIPKRSGGREHAATKVVTGNSSQLREDHHQSGGLENSNLPDTNAHQTAYATARSESKSSSSQLATQDTQRQIRDLESKRDSMVRKHEAEVYALKKQVETERERASKAEELLATERSAKRDLYTAQKGSVERLTEQLGAERLANEKTRKDAEKTSQELQASVSELEKIRGTLKASDVATKRLQQELLASKKEVERYAHLHTEIVIERDKLQEQLRQETAEREKKAAACAAAEQDRDDAEEIVLNLQNKLTLIESSNSSKSGEVEREKENLTLELRRTTKQLASMEEERRLADGSQKQQEELIVVQKKEILQLKKTKDDLLQKKEEVLSAVNQLQADKTVANDKMQSLQKVLSEKEMTLSRQLEEKHALERDLDNLRSELKQTRHRLDELETEIKTTRKAGIESLEFELRQSKEVLRETEKSLREEIGSLNAQLVSSRKEKEEAQRAVARSADVVDSDVAHRQLEIDAAKKETAEWRQQLAAAQDELAEFRRNKEEMKQAMEKQSRVLKEENEDLKTKLEATSADLCREQENGRKDRDRVSGDLVEVTVRHDELLAEVARLKEVITTLETERMKVDSQVEEETRLESELLTREVKMLEEKLETAEKLRCQQSEEFAALKSKNDTLRVELCALEKQDDGSEVARLNDQLRTEVTKLQEVITSMESERMEGDHRAQEEARLKIDLEALRLENTQLADAVSALQAERGDLSGELTLLQEELEALRDEESNPQRSLSDLEVLLEEKDQLEADLVEARRQIEISALKAEGRDEGKSGHEGLKFKTAEEKIRKVEMKNKQLEEEKTQTLKDLMQVKLELAEMKGKIPENGNSEVEGVGSTTADDRIRMLEEEKKHLEEENAQVVRDLIQTKLDLAKTKEMISVKSPKKKKNNFW